TNNASFQHAVDAPMSVRPEQNNFAGLGAVASTDKGEEFATVEIGVQAHLEHILIYAGERIARPIAERTAKVQAWGVLDDWLSGFTRPITYRDLALRWFPFDSGYDRKLAAVATEFYRAHCARELSLGAFVRDDKDGSDPGADISTGWVARRSGEAPQTVSAALLEPRSLAQGTPITPPKPQLVTRQQTNGDPSSVSALPSVPPVALPVRRPKRTVVASLNPRILPKRTTEPKRKPKKRTAPRVKKAIKKTADDAVRDLVAGRLVRLKTDMGATIPVRFERSGRMRGDANGLAFFLGAARDSGTWWAERGLLCKRWKIWLSRKTMCLQLKRRGRIVHWRAEDGRSGTATIVR
ncbi:MAG: hypothetical protein AAFY64_10790, partial [Pseudomonadota bacterium]